MVKYPLWIHKFKVLYYTIQHEGGRHTDFRQMSISPRQTTANSCKMAFSLNVVESASDDDSFWFNFELFTTVAGRFATLPVRHLDVSLPP